MERGNGSSEDITARVLDLASPIGRGQRHEPTRYGRQDRRLCENGPVPVARGHIDSHRDEHRRPQTGHQKADHIAHRAQIKHGAKGWRGREAVSTPCV